jgi:serpin B
MKKSRGIIFKRIAISGIAVFIPLLFCPHDGPVSQDLVTGNNTFGFEMYRQLVKKDSNLLFSPYSISSALSMVYVGSKQNTAQEMRTALHVSFGQGELPSEFHRLTRGLAINNKYEKLLVANGLCLTGGDVRKDFKKILKGKFGAEIFRGGLEKINRWVRQKTMGKIDKILSQLDPGTVCVLLNAVYFKAPWDSPFDAMNTRDLPFYVSEEKKIAVPTMSKKEKVRILDKETFRIAAFPYHDDVLSMCIVLPKAVDGIAGIEDSLSYQKVKDWLTELDGSYRVKTDVFMPKFAFSKEYDLIPSCQALGIKDAFKDSIADLSGIGGPRGLLWISQIKHKASVEVNEEGTVAAAATAVEITKRCALLEKRLEFRIDHPFLFLIRDNRTGSILFLGRVVDPSIL